MFRVFDKIVQTVGKTYSIYRNDNKISTVKGVIQSDFNVQFPYDADIQINDSVVLDATQERYVVKEIKKILVIQGDAVDFLDVYFMNSKKPSRTIGRQVNYNIGTAYGSAFGDNAVSNYYVTYNNIEELIESHGYNIDDFQDILNTLKTTLSGNECPKGFLSSFSDTLAKHSWLSSPIAQLLLSFVTGRAI